MNFPYFGATVVNASLTQAAGTRREIVDFMAATAAAAGWTYVSGLGTGTPKLRSGVTPHGVRCKLQLTELGDATQAHALALTDLDEVGDAACAGLLLPGVGFQWRCIASPYYVRMFRDHGTVTGADTFTLDNLWIPSHLRASTTEAFLSTANSNSNGNEGSFRTTISLNRTMANLAWNGYRWGANNSNANVGMPFIVTPNAGNAGSTSRIWADGTRSVLDIQVGWGTASSLDTSTAIRGLWGDAFLYCDFNIPYGTVLTVDGHDWLVTGPNTSGQPYAVCFLIA